MIPIRFSLEYKETCMKTLMKSIDEEQWPKPFLPGLAKFSGMGMGDLISIYIWKKTVVVSWSSTTVAIKMLKCWSDAPVICRDTNDAVEYRNGAEFLLRGWQSHCIYNRTDCIYDSLTDNEHTTHDIKTPVLLPKEMLSLAFLQTYYWAEWLGTVLGTAGSPMRPGRVEIGRLRLLCEAAEKGRPKMLQHLLQGVRTMPWFENRLCMYATWGVCTPNACGLPNCHHEFAGPHLALMELVNSLVDTEEGTLLTVRGDM